ncbi:hypothetical protein PAYE108092_16890 [Paracoccus yeei]
MTDADAQPPIGVANVLVNGPQAVVPRVPPAQLEPHLARGKVQFVVQHQDLGGVELQIAHRLAHGLAGKVHEGAGFQQHGAGVAQASLGDLALEPRPPGGETMVGRDAIDRHEAHVVAVAFVFRARIAQADQQYHRILRRLGRRIPVRATGGNFYRSLVLGGGDY